MLDRGLTKVGAAQALGWSEAKVSQRARLLALPDDVARAFGDGWLSMGCLDFTLGFYERFPDHATVLARYLIHAARESGRVNSMTGHDLSWQFSHATEWARHEGVDGGDLIRTARDVQPARLRRGRRRRVAHQGEGP
jgi:hypothetical protein